MGKILPKRSIEELIYLRLRVEGVEEIGFIDGVSGYLSDEESIIEMLQKNGCNYNNIIHSLRDYLIGYNIGEVVFENNSGEELDKKEMSSSPIKENEKARDLYEEIKSKQKTFVLSFDDIFDDINSFYNIGRRDALFLEKDNSKYIASILIQSTPYLKIFNAVWEYLKGFYFQKEVMKAEEGKEYIEKFPALCFYAETSLILERVCK